MKKLFLATAVAALSLGGCTQVNSGEAAVWQYYGGVQKTGDEGPGFYVYNPWSWDVTTMDTRQQKWQEKTEVYTKDIQKADVKFVLNYHLNPAQAGRMYGRVGVNWADNILPQYTLQAIKNEFGLWDAVRVVEHRGDVTTRITMALRQSLGRQDIILDSFDLIDVKYDGPFEKSVERKQVAVQDAITAQNKTVQFSEEAKQAVIKAKGEADALAITATALRNDPTLIEYKKIQAWQATGGKVPQTVVGNSSPPFINLGSK
jgi:regulator of protease activity HflC (stomatin/prohibitin superfamily)